MRALSHFRQRRALATDLVGPHESRPYRRLFFYALSLAPCVPIRLQVRTSVSGAVLGTIPVMLVA